MHLIGAEYLRFLISGTLRTVAIYLLYLGLLRLVDYQVAYAIAYVAGIALAYLLDTRYVFRSTWSWRSFLRFPIVYVVQYLLGVALLWLLVERFGADEALAPIFILAVLVPVTFAMSRLIVRKPAPGTPAP